MVGLEAYCVGVHGAAFFILAAIPHHPLPCANWVHWQFWSEISCWSSASWWASPIHQVNLEGEKQSLEGLTFLLLTGLVFILATGLNLEGFGVSLVEVRLEVEG